LLGLEANGVVMVKTLSLRHQQAISKGMRRIHAAKKRRGLTWRNKVIADD
jgi:hypothetical protein